MVTIVDSKHWSQLKKEQQHRKDKQLCHCFWCLIGRSKLVDWVCRPIGGVVMLAGMMGEKIID
jgi:hypothetical protein